MVAIIEDVDLRKLPLIPSNAVTDFFYYLTGIGVTDV